MSSKWLYAFGLSIMAASVPAGAAQTAAAAAEAGPVRQDSLELARLLNPAEPLVKLAGRSFDEAFDKGMAADGGGEALEKAYPGIVEALRQAVRETTLTDLRNDMPQVHQRYARFFASSFTPEETAELIQFYQSPTGRRMIEAKFASMDISNLTDRFAENPDSKLSAGDVKQLNDGAVSGVLKGMDAEDIRTLIAFGARPVAKKLKAAAPRIAEIEAEIANEPDPALDAAIEEASRKVYARFGLSETAGDR